MDLRALSKLCDGQYYRICDRADVGKFSKKLTFYVYVNSNNPGKIPHVHVVDKKPLGDKFHACVQLTKSEYFEHSGKESKFNSAQRKAFNEFMHEEFYDEDLGIKVSNYQYAVAMWNKNNSDVRISLKRDSNGKIIIPDYSNIDDYRK